MDRAAKKRRISPAISRVRDVAGPGIGHVSRVARSQEFATDTNKPPNGKAVRLRLNVSLMI
jgi:hypothetical protein